MTGSLHDTICALATPPGEGGIGIVRLSGEKAVEVAGRVVRLRSGQALDAIQARLLCLCDLVLDASTGGSSQPAGPDVPLDEALVVVMRAPRSFTAEDVVEIQCHGGPYLLQRVLDELLRAGARLAEPGEFTKRAFLNGRIDLTQAEAVLDTIRAKTAAGLRLAQEQLQGRLSADIHRHRETLIRLVAHVEAAMDFADEDLTFISSAQLRDELDRTERELLRLAESCREGRMLREGVAVALVGRPNVGKSSLLNALLDTDRAIVTPIAGTTRDVLDEMLNVRGIPIRLLDTAGLRETDDPVEREGVRRSRQAMEQAELLLVVVDGAHGLTEDDRRALASCPGASRLLLINKCDLPSGLEPSELEPFCRTLGLEPQEAVVRVSAKTGEGLDTLRDAIRRTLIRPEFEAGETVLVTRLRHRAALMTAVQALSHAGESVRRGLAGEFVAMDLRGALDALGELTGAVTTDDILDRIFGEFCIGK